MLNLVAIGTFLKEYFPFILVPLLAVFTFYVVLFGFFPALFDCKLSTGTWTRNTIVLSCGLVIILLFKAWRPLRAIGTFLKEYFPFILMPLLAAFTFYPVLLEFFPALFDCKPSTETWISNITTGLSYVFLTMLLITFGIRYRQLLSAGESESDATVHRLYGANLWVLVFYIGTVTAIHNVDASTTEHATEALPQVTPQLFVTWFLSVVTMIAAEVFTHLERLHAFQERSLNETQRSVNETQEANQRLKETSTSLIASSLEAVSLRDKFEKLAKLDLDTERFSPSKYAVAAGGRRFDIMENLLKARTDWLSKLDGDPIRAAVFEKILIPSLVPYAGTDAWEVPPCSGLKIVQTASYVLYSELTERIFRMMMKHGKTLLKDERERLEVVTTLKVPLASFYNVIRLSGWRDKMQTDLQCLQKGCAKMVWDTRSRTTARWERYLAIQQIALETGKQDGSLGLTRIFLKDTPLISDLSSQDVWAHARALNSRDQLVDKVKKTMDNDGCLPDSDKDLKQLDKLVEDHINHNLAVCNWCKLDCKFKGEGVVYPVAYGSEPKDGVNLEEYLIKKHLTLPNRFLNYRYDNNLEGSEVRVDDLPLDIFAVGVTGAKINECPRAKNQWNPCFVLVLESDNLGTTNVTRVVVTPTNYSEHNERDNRLIRNIRTLLEHAAGSGNSGTL